MAKKKTTKRVLVRMTKNHLDRGIPSNCFACPVARATQDFIEKLNPRLDVIRVMVLGTKTRVRYSYRGDEQELNFTTPNSTRVSAFINSFDDRRDVKPLSFYIQVPTTLLKKDQP